MKASEYMCMGVLTNRRHKGTQMLHRFHAVSETEGLLLKSLQGLSGDVRKNLPSASRTKSWLLNLSVSELPAGACALCLCQNKG